MGDSLCTAVAGALCVCSVYGWLLGAIQGRASQVSGRKPPTKLRRRTTTYRTNSGYVARHLAE
jgi:hypothetical protein